MLVQRRFAKAAIALLVGLPGTVLLFPWAAGFALGNIAVLFGVVTGGPIGMAPHPSITSALLGVMWNAAGLIGLIGFWTWALVPDITSLSVRIFVIVSLVLGVVATIPLFEILHGPYWWTLLSLGCVVGLGVCVSLIWGPHAKRAEA